MAEILRHPWMVKGYDGPVENYLPPRTPLTLPVDPHVVREMSGYGFGSTNELRAKLEGLLHSEWYHQQLQRLSPDLPTTEFPGGAGPDPLSSPTAPMGSSFLLGTSVTRSAENMALAAREALKKRTSFWRRTDPIPVDEVAMDPLISMYFLVLEKVRNESHSLISGAPALGQGNKGVTSPNHSTLSPPVGQTTRVSPGESHLSVPPSDVMARPMSSPGQFSCMPAATSASPDVLGVPPHHPAGPASELKAVDSLVSMDDKPADSRPSHRIKPNALAAAEGVLRRISRVIRPHLGKTRARPTEEREASGLSTSLPQPRMSTGIPPDGPTTAPDDYVPVASTHPIKFQDVSTIPDGTRERPRAKSPKAIKKDSKARRISALLTNKLSNTLGSSPSSPTNEALGLHANTLDTATKEYIPDRSDTSQQMEQDVTLPCDRIPEGTPPITDTPEDDGSVEGNSSSPRTASTLSRRISSLLTRTGSVKDRQRPRQVASPNAKMASSSPLGFAHRLHSPSLRLRPPFQRFGSDQTPSDSFPPAYRLGQVRNSQSTSDCVESSRKSSVRSGSQLRVLHHSAVVSHGKGGLASETGDYQMCDEEDGLTGSQTLHHRRLISVAQMSSPGGPRIRTSTDPHLHGMGSPQLQQPMSASMVATMRTVSGVDGKVTPSYSFDLGPSHPVSTATIPHRSLSSRLARKSRDSSQVLTRAKKTQHLVDPATAADAVAVLERQKSMRNERADQGIRPVFLKGLFSVATTTTKSPQVIRTNIVRVLDKYHVKFREGKGCFECIATQFPLSTVAPSSSSKKDGEESAGFPSFSLNANGGMSQRTPSGDSNQSQPGRLALKSPAPSLGTRDSEGSTLPLLGRTPPGLASSLPNSVDASVSPHPGTRTLLGVAPLITHPNSVPMYTASNSILFFDDDDRLSALSMSTIPLPNHRLGMNGNPSSLTTKDPTGVVQDTTVSPGVCRNPEGEQSRDLNGGTDYRPSVRWDHTLTPGTNIPGSGAGAAEGSVETLSIGLGRTVSSPPLDMKPENVVIGDSTVRSESTWSSGTPPRPRSQVVPTSMGAIQEEDVIVTVGSEHRPSTEEVTPTSVKESVDVAELQHRCASLQLRTATSGDLTGGTSPHAVSGASYESQRPRLPRATTPPSLDSLPPSALGPPGELIGNMPGTLGTAESGDSTWTFVRFEIAIVKVPWLRGVYGIRFRQVVGPMWQYKHLCSFILKELRL
ncbi:Serine/threonine-protein kinase [Dispira simplex]|nr:Serine/threonine-protein kinase [Dispira simplex]